MPVVMLIFVMPVVMQETHDTHFLFSTSIFFFFKNVKKPADFSYANIIEMVTAMA